MRGELEPSTRLTAMEVSKLMDGSVRALELGFPLNWFLTINLTRGRVEHPKRFVSHVRSLFQDFLRHHNAGPLCCVGVLEAVGGLNLHLLLHVPPDLLPRFQALSRTWCEGAGAIYDGKVWQGEPIWYSDLDQMCRFDFEKYLRHGLFGALRYICKGIDEDQAETFDIETSPQGLVFGKRIICSQFWSGWADPENRKSGSVDLRTVIEKVCPELLVYDPNYVARRDQQRRRRVRARNCNSYPADGIRPTRALRKNSLKMEETVQANGDPLRGAALPQTTARIRYSRTEGKRVVCGDTALGAQGNAEKDLRTPPTG